MLPAVPLPSVFIQMTSPEVVQVGVATAPARPMGEAPTNAVIGASAAAHASTATPISLREEHLGICIGRPFWSDGLKCCADHGRAGTPGWCSGLRT